MSRLSSFLFGMVAGAGLLQGVTTYHIVRASDGLHFIAKQPARLGETYVDIRAFTMTDWAARPQLASALVQANQQQLLGDSAVNGPSGQGQAIAARLAEKVRPSHVHAAVNLFAIGLRIAHPVGQFAGFVRPHDPNRHH